ncbi:MAG TPA: hypothetical protein VFG53_19670 [Anaeromyxobacter sp.]|nr:hypothetical protein [Anaeromyxobacter sp.]
MVLAALLALLLADPRGGAVARAAPAPGSSSRSRDPGAPCGERGSRPKIASLDEDAAPQFASRILRGSANARFERSGRGNVPAALFVAPSP